MRVLEPKELEKRRDHRAKKAKKKHHKRRLVPVVFVIVIAYAATVLVIPLSSLQTDAISVKLPGATPVSMPWPAYGQAAVGAVGYGLLAQNGEQKPLPIASVAKVITAVAVLKVRPIPPGTQGEIITLTAEDVAIYNKYLAENQSVVRVTAGEQITEYQALQALLLPSANNIADVLVRWAFGSTQEYLAFVNPFAKTLGMANTNVADASGFSPETTSVAVDLAHLAEIAMNHPVISEIVGQPQADLPVAGTVFNVNNLLGQQGINGIKTGNTDEAGGCYLFSAKRDIDATHAVTVVGAVMGAPERSMAMRDALPLLDEAFKNFQVITPVHAQDKVGVITQAGGSQVPIIVRQGLAVVVWTAQDVRSELKSMSMSSTVTAGDDAGKLVLYVGNMTHELPLMAGGTIPGRSLLWRLRHAAGYL